MTVIKWSWHYGSLMAVAHESIDGAVRDAHWQTDRGDEALDCLEVINGDGTTTIVDSDEVLAMTPKPYPGESAAKVVGIVEIRSPSGTYWAHVDDIIEGWGSDPGAQWRELLGEDRVRVTMFPVGDGVTDDTDAIQAMLDRTGRVDLPPGTYRIAPR